MAVNPEDMTDQDLCKEIRRIWNGQNAAETDERWEELEAQFVPLWAEMERRGLGHKDVPAWDAV